MYSLNPSRDQINKIIPNSPDAWLNELTTLVNAKGYLLPLACLHGGSIEVERGASLIVEFVTFCQSVEVKVVIS